MQVFSKKITNFLLKQLFAKHEQIPKNADFIGIFRNQLSHMVQSGRKNIKVGDFFTLFG